MEVGVVGGHETVVTAVREAGADPLVGTPREVATAAAIVAVGESAIGELARVGTEAPVLPVEAGAAVRSVPGIGIEPAVANLVNGEFEATEYPVMGANALFGTTRALYDLMLVTSEPARISEYTVFDRDETVARFRADGVVVATPAGSRGYARAAGGPVLAPCSEVVAVVPVAPFATNAGHWVLPMDRLGIQVERDETPVELRADDTVAGAVALGETTRFGIDDRIRVAVTPESVGFYG